MNKKPEFSIDEFVNSGKTYDININEVENGKISGVEVEEDRKGCFSPNECMICYEKLGKISKTVGCKLCQYRCHKKCYKTFTNKNQNFLMKCLHCQTRSIYHEKKRYLTWCFC